MSSCLTLKYQDEIYMCGDSAVSKIDNDTGKMIRATGEDSTKIFQFGNYVVFASGIKQIIDPLLIELWKNKENLSFQLISKKAKEAVNKFPEINKQFALGLTVSTNEGGKLTSCVIHSMHDCQVEFKDENKCLIMFNGCECEKLKEKYLKYCDVASSIRDLYLKVYREMEKEVEEIGGTLTVYKLDKNKINRLFSENITPEKNQNFLLHQHEDGSYTEMVNDGFQWRTTDGQIHSYLRLIYSGKVQFDCSNHNGSNYGELVVALSSQYVGVFFDVLCSLETYSVPESNLNVIPDVYPDNSDFENGVFTMHGGLNLKRADGTSVFGGTITISYIAIGY